MKDQRTTRLGFALAVIGGFIGATGAIMAHQRLKTNTPEQVLKQIKQRLNDGGHQITGGWIEDHALPYEQNDFKTTVYYGGLNCIEKNKPVLYSFVVDANNGAIYEIEKV